MDRGSVCIGESAVRWGDVGGGRAVGFGPAGRRVARVRGGEPDDLSGTRGGARGSRGQVAVAVGRLFSIRRSSQTEADLLYPS